MFKRLVGIAIGLTLCGCAQQVWYRENTTLEEARRDLAEVKYEAIKSTPPYRGAEDPVAAGIGDAAHQIEVIQAGMEAKGYRLIPRAEAEAMGLRH